MATCPFCSPQWRTMTMKHPFPLDGLSVDRTLAVPLHRQLYGCLRRMIEDRFLTAGSVLPSSRALAGDLRVARNTVVNAYEQLATEGYIAGRPGARPTVVDLPGGAAVPFP